MSQAYTPVQRTMALAAASLLFLGLLTGFFAAAALSGQISADGQAALAAHLNALLGAFFIVAVAWTMPMLRYGAAGQRRLAWLVVGANFANWLITAIKAVLHVRGIARTGATANDAIFLALGVLVVVPSVVAAGAWIVGFRRPAAESRAAMTAAIR